MPQRTHQTTLILARHGETEWNLSGRIQGHTDSPLTALGAEQHRRVADRLSAVNIAAVYASPSGRASDLGELIAAQHGLSPIFAEDLRERCYGRFEGLTLAQIAEENSTALDSWLVHPNRELLAPPKGETQADMSRRVMSSLRDIITRHPGETVAVATHGGPIKSAVFAVLDIPIAAWDRTWVTNGSLTTIRGLPDSLRVACFNDTCHLNSTASRPRTIEG
ncbi:MAG: histidine phosphatase family protein [Armatimonadota bacterium]